MSASSRRVLRQTWASVRMVLVLTVLLGIAYPLVVTGVAQVVLPGRADGSLVERGGRVVGSSLVGQDFGRDPRYFQSRPSASGYDPLATGASNLGPESRVLLRQVEHRRAAVARLDGTDPAAVPPDAVTASASGLDPHISPQYAARQVARVARARGLDPSAVRRLVAEHTEGRTLGFLGEPRVDVLLLNLALDASSRAAD
jgi:K+-transporting ATPase ATPase C chain